MGKVTDWYRRHTDGLERVHIMWGVIAAAVGWLLVAAYGACHGP